MTQRLLWLRALVGFLPDKGQGGGTRHSAVPGRCRLGGRGESTSDGPGTTDLWGCFSSIVVPWPKVSWLGKRGPVAERL